MPELMDDGTSGTQDGKSKVLWEGKPDQNFRLWNSKGVQDTLQSSLFVAGSLLVTGLLVFLLITLIRWIGGGPLAGVLDKTIILTWLLICAALIMLFLYFDIHDYLFRRGSKYFISEKGIGFILGYRKKKRFLIEWKRIKSVWFSKSDSRLYIKYDSKEAEIIDTSFPNSTETEDYPFIEVFYKNEINKLFNAVGKYKKVKMK